MWRSDLMLCPPPQVAAVAALIFLTCGPTVCAEEILYNRDVRPILSENCFACHGFDHATREAGLRLDTPEGAAAKLESGMVAIKPGSPEESELMRRILSSDHGEMMPPEETGKRLTKEQIRILSSWIEQGANYEKHWAFLKPVKAERPASPLNRTGTQQSAESVETSIDLFVNALLSKKNLQPSPEADRITLLRRVSLDLTGLPPSISEVEEFLTDSESDAEAAYQKVVDRLLQSAAHGERWGRWWLDQARYADSNGYSVDAPRQIWKYRDWVVNALNRDMPFDQFTIEQLAGDLLPEATDDQRIATGFHRNTQINQEGGIDPEQFRIDSVFDRVATTGTVWLGLTIGCAQCHDHKFDPILQKEYYQLFAFFNNQDEPTLTVYDSGIDAPALTKEKKSLEQTMDEQVAASSDAMAMWESGLTDDQRRGLSKELVKVLETDKSKRNAVQNRSLFAAGPGLSDEAFQKAVTRTKEIERVLSGGVTTLVMKELASPRKSTVFTQGDFTRPADEVSCGTPSALPPLQASAGSANRLDLARWIVSPEHPLTARVIVNRVWQQYFGRGIVETDNDFGLQGSMPTHPELLDWLAVDFMEKGWSLKQLHRQIVMSGTYRQSSHVRADLAEKDPDNYLLARQRRLRLDAEIVRDVSLSASGLLSGKMGGPPVYPPIPQGVMSLGQANREWKVSAGEDRYRRGFYTFVYRATPPPSMSVFDAPDGYSTCTRRVRSNTPLQALALMNDTAFVEFAEALAKIIQQDGLETAFRRCTSRFPSLEEVAVLKTLDTLSAARVLLNLDETVTRE
jgi:hypothetical protein